MTDLAALAAAVAVIADPRPGQRSAETLAAIQARDDALRAARDKFFPHLSDANAAERLARALAEFRDGPWWRDRLSDVLPERHRGRLSEYLWHALSARDRLLSARSIRRLLATSYFTNK